MYTDDMKDYKIILLGSQCSGKSTLISYLQKTTDLVCLDHDEEIKRRNGGTYPKEREYVANELQPKIENDVMAMERVVYSASFWGLGEDEKIHNDRIESAIKAGFSFIHLKTDKEILLKRNADRVVNSKNEDASQAFDWYLSVYKDMQNKNYFAHEIETNQAVEEVAADLVSLI